MLSWRWKKDRIRLRWFFPSLRRMYASVKHECIWHWRLNAVDMTWRRTRWQPTTTPSTATNTADECGDGVYMHDADTILSRTDRQTSPPPLSSSVFAVFCFHLSRISCVTECGERMIVAGVRVLCVYVCLCTQSVVFETVFQYRFDRMSYTYRLSSMWFGIVCDGRRWSETNAGQNTHISCRRTLFIRYVCGFIFRRPRRAQTQTESAASRSFMVERVRLLAVRSQLFQYSAVFCSCVRTIVGTMNGYFPPATLYRKRTRTHAPQCTHDVSGVARTNVSYVFFDSRATVRKHERGQLIVRIIAKWNTRCVCTYVRAFWAFEACCSRTGAVGERATNVTITETCTILRSEAKHSVLHALHSDRVDRSTYTQNQRIHINVTKTETCAHQSS